jgi:Glycosyltransferase sugar-binding region containing DXD motif
MMMMKDQNLLAEELKKYYVDFDAGMGEGTGYYRQVRKFTGRNLEIFNFFKALYEKNHFLNVQPQESPKVPKIIHQIWIGNRPIPQKIKEYQRTWVDCNPGWEYKFWTNENVKTYRFANPKFSRLFEQPLTLGERVDVLRYDLLYKYGGIYADCDCVCFKPFDVFAHSYDFFAGILQPMFATMENAIFVQTCLIGSKPGHPIVEKISRILESNWNNVSADHQGDEFYTTLRRTFFTLTPATVSEGGKNGNIDIAMPPSYFLPISPYPVFDIMIRGLGESILGIFRKELSPYSFFKEHSFSHHYSHKEWAKDLYSTMTFKHKGWTLLNPLDWLLFWKSKLLDKNTQKTIARQTFEELISQ